MIAQRRLIAFLLTLSLLPTGVPPLTATAVPSFQAESDLFRGVPEYSIADSGFPAAATPVVPSPVPGSVSVRGPLQSAPLVFIENVGQFDEQARFQVRGSNATVHLTDDAVWLTLVEKPSLTQAPSPNLQGGATPLPTPESAREVGDEGQSRQGVNLKFSFLGANRDPQLEPFNPLDLHLSYFLSSDSANWRADVPTWGGVRYRDLYPGVDLEMIGEDGGWRWRLMARPGAHLDVVRLQVEGAETVTVDSSGRLRMQTAVGSLTGPALTAQHGHLPTRPVIAGNTVRFAPSPQGAARPATVPMESATSVGGSGELVYSTFLGGNGFDAGNAIAAGSDGTAYVAGETYSTDFPTTPGAFDTALDGSRDIFVTNLQSDGNTPAFSTFLGGDSDDRGYAIALDDTGSVYLVGSSSSSDFPITAGAYGTVHKGGEDVVVVKLNATGSALLYSTYLGGGLDDLGLGLAVDGAGAVYIAGHTASPGFPTTPDAFDTSWGGGYPYCDAFVTKLDPAGTALEYSTFLGGTGEDYANNIAVDSSGSAYVVGWTNSKYFPATPGSFGTIRTKSSDAFVAKLNGSGSDLIYSGLLGGSQDDQGQGIAVDGLGAAYLTGQTSSVNFPVTPGAYQIIKPTPGGVWDGFVAKVSSDGATLIYSTYLGGSISNCETPGTHRECVIALDASGVACVVGRTLSADFPTTPDGFDVTYNGNEDGFVAALSPDGSSLVYGSFIGGASSDQALAVALDTTGLAYVSGRTDSSDFPTSTGAFDGSYSGGGDAFVAKLPRVTVPQRTCYVRLSDDPTDYDTVQSAVDASAHVTDVVKVAGYCAGINDHGGLRQVVYISKTLTLRGGYTTTNWIEPDPAANPTTLDARGQGRVLYVTGDISPTLEGLRITGGDAPGLSGSPGGNAGGGVYVITAAVTTYTPPPA